MFEELLQTISQVAVTLAGFSGVVFALGNRSGRELSDKEESGLMHMLLTSFGPVLISLVALVLLKSNIDNTTAWRICCAILGIFAFTGSTKAFIDEYKGRHSLSKELAWVTPIGAQAFGVFNLLVAFGYFIEIAHIIFTSTLIYLMWVSIVYFISLLKQYHGRS